VHWLRHLEQSAARLVELARSAGFENVSAGANPVKLPINGIDQLLLAHAAVSEAADTINRLTIEIQAEQQRRVAALNTAVTDVSAAQAEAVRAAKIAQQMELRAHDLAERLAEDLMWDERMVEVSPQSASKAAQKATQLAVQANKHARSTMHDRQHAIARVGRVRHNLVRAQELVEQASETCKFIEEQSEAYWARRHQLGASCLRDSGLASPVPLRAERERWWPADRLPADHLYEEVEQRAEAQAWAQSVDAFDALGSEFAFRFLSQHVEYEAPADSRLLARPRALYRQGMVQAWRLALAEAMRQVQEVAKEVETAEHEAELAGRRAEEAEQAKIIAEQVKLEAEQAAQLNKRAEERSRLAWKQVTLVAGDLWSGRELEERIEDARLRLAAHDEGGTDRSESVQRMLWSFLVEPARHRVQIAYERSEMADRAAESAANRLRDAIDLVSAADAVLATQPRGQGARIVPFDLGVPWRGLTAESA